MSDATLGEDAPVYIPREQLPIPFFDDAVLAVRREDGQIYLNIRDMCESLELAFTAQRRRIFATDRLRAAVARFRVRTAGGRQVAEFLELELVPIWLLGVQPRRASAAVRQKLSHVQDYLIRSVQAAFAQLTGLPDMVHAWGAGRAARDAKLSSGAAIHACWAILNARFKVAAYTDLPAARYDECCAFIQEMYVQLTGERLDIVEQEDMGI